MATKTNIANLRAKKPWDFPGRLAARNAEVMPVGAWVQPESLNIHQTYEAVLSAEEEEARITAIRAEKDARLRKFQLDVKHRVAHVDRLKKQQQLTNTCKAVEVERNVLAQSAQASERQTPRKNHCVHRDNTSHVIRQSASINTQGGIAADSSNEAEKTNVFEEQSQKVHQFTCAARRKLTSKRVITENYMKDNLPGGIWKTGPTRDHPVSRQTVEPDVIDLEDADTGGDLYTECYNNNENDDVDKEHEAGYQVVRADGNADDKENDVPHIVHSETSALSETRQERITRKSAPSICGTDIARVSSVPNIYPGVSNIEEKQRAITQRAMYRRLFMDIEREQVKENQRAEQHRRKIAQLKREKEEDRRRQEILSQQTVTPKDPGTGETVQQVEERQRQEEESMQNLVHERKQKIKRSVEATRFVDALKAQLREKIEKQNIDLPRLCMCGPTVWDTSPDTCANNCIFYHNPKAYTRALQSLLSSCDVA